VGTNSPVSLTRHGLCPGNHSRVAAALHNEFVFGRPVTDSPVEDPGARHQAGENSALSREGDIPALHGQNNAKDFGLNSASGHCTVPKAGQLGVDSRLLEEGAIEVSTS